MSSSWNPSSELESLLDRYCRSTGRVVLYADTELDQTDWLPLVDIRQDSEQLVIWAELPGVDKSAIEVTVVDNQLIIRGEKLPEVEADQSGLRTCNERCYGHFERTFRIPSGVDSTGIDACYRNGVLSITIPCQAAREAATCHVEVH